MFSLQCYAGMQLILPEDLFEGKRVWAIFSSQTQQVWVYTHTVTSRKSVWIKEYELEGYGYQGQCKKGSNLPAL